MDKIWEMAWEDVGDRKWPWPGDWFEKANKNVLGPENDNYVQRPMNTTTNRLHARRSRPGNGSSVKGRRAS